MGPSKWVFRDESLGWIKGINARGRGEGVRMRVYGGIYIPLIPYIGYPPQLLARYRQRNNKRARNSYVES